MSSNSEALAERFLTFSRSEMDPAAVERATVAITDTIGVALAGMDHEAMDMLKAVVLPTATAGAATILGSDLRLNALDAALLNGTAAHMLDYDDSNSQLLGHPSVAVLPALLALAEERGDVSGKEFVRAYIVGFETAARLGTGVGRYQYTHGWHPTATIGVFGAIAACSVIAGLDTERAAMAIGLGAHMAAGVKSNFGSMTKPFGVGHAARNALMAVKLAQAGFTSGVEALEHHHGYLNVFNRGPENYDFDKVLQDWGAPYCILDWGIKQKRFPCCYACLAPIDGMLDIRDRQGARADEVEAIHVAVHPIRFPHINVPDPATPLAAKFSVHFCVAKALANGRLTIEDFEAGGLDQPGIAELMRRVSFGTYEHDNIAGAEVSVALKDGRTLRSSIDAAWGATPRNPLSAELIRDKFMNCSTRVLDERAATRLYEALIRIDEATEIGAVFELARSAGAGSPVRSTARTDRSAALSSA